ncbi:hypothetical protein Y032_0017g3217 [Ancylostoma ceylanicum]|uniref:Uncharacterized protein n=1 Tax=Ancylostoma ceylanicum TaxID=53326 RepID=A0A016V663_9BILA|nr:hypothetical protein Y032_0017g3217 [Ancylostoma ceylanicum]
MNNVVSPKWRYVSSNLHLPEASATRYRIQAAPNDFEAPFPPRQQWVKHPVAVKFLPGVDARCEADLLWYDVTPAPGGSALELIRISSQSKPLGSLLRLEEGYDSRIGHWTHTLVLTTSAPIPL